MLEKQYGTGAKEGDVFKFFWVSVDASISSGVFICHADDQLSVEKFVVFLQLQPFYH